MCEPSWRKFSSSFAPHARIAEQIEQRIEQHRAVAGREHEAVAVRPVRPAGVEFHEALEQHGRDVGHAHRHAGMAGFGLLHRVHRERADGVGAAARIGFALPRPASRDAVIIRFVHVTPFLRFTSSRILGVRMSCIARSSLLPGMTIELARDIQLPAIIATR